jgi:hypothetical protein
MLERPALGTGAELLCEHVESEFAIYLCLLVSLSNARFLISKVKYNWKIRSVYRIGNICRASRGARDGTVCGTIDRVGWTVRSRDIYSTT